MKTYAPAVSSHYKHFLVVLVLFDRGVRVRGVFHVAEKGVAVASHDEVQTRGLLRQLQVLLIANVSQGDDALDVYRTILVLARSG